MRHRRAKHLQLRPQILILCEGSETEPNYFDALARDRSITSFNIPRDHETCPLRLVQRAIRELKKNKSLSMVFVVIDRDNHDLFNDAIGLAENYSAVDDRLNLIVSYPSFELWLLLHEQFTRAPMTQAEAFSRLKKAVPEYEKSSAEIMDRFIAKLDDSAMIYAKRSIAEARQVSEFNSSTVVHEMIEKILTS